MAVVHEVSTPASTTADVYTPGSGVTAVVNVTAQNKGTGAANVSIGVKVSSTVHYFFRTYSLAANSAPIGVAGIMLDNTTTLHVESSTGNVDFIVNGRDDA